MEKDQRLYRHYDALAIQKAKTLRAFTEDDLAALNDLDSDIDAAFLSDWDLAIDNAEALPPDWQQVAILTQQSAEVEQSHAKCIEAVRDLRYHATKAYSKKSAEWALFNFKGLARARTSTSRLAVYVKVLHLVADGLKAELMAKGMSQAQIDVLGTSAMALFNADVEQELEKHQRLRQTQERIAVMNHLWRFCQQAHKAAQIVFSDSYGNWVKYALG